MPTGERNKTVRGWTLWGLGLLLAVPAIVQAERLPIKIYTIADGLAHDRVKRIVRDSRGFLWFCTLEGLSRFDGYRFTNYRTEHGLPHSSTNDLIETRNGVYWVATNGGGVARFNPTQLRNAEFGLRIGARSKEQGAGSRERQAPRTERHAIAIRNLFTVYPVGDEPATNRVNVLYEDRQGQLWAGTDGGLFRLDETKGTFGRVELGLPSRPDPVVQVWAFVEDREGSLWIGTSWGLVQRWPDGRIVHYTVLPVEGTDHVRALLMGREGSLWVGHRGAGLLRLRIADFGLRNEESRSDSKKSHIRDPKSEIRNGPIRNPMPGEARLADAIRNPMVRIPQSAIRNWYRTADGLAHDWVFDLRQSSDGRIWVATNGGLSEFDGERFRSYTTAEGLSDNRLATLAEDLDGNLWISSQASGAMKLARNGFTTYSEADGLGHADIRSIFENQAGEFYAISFRHFINRFDGRRFTTVRPNVPKQVTVWTSLQDHTGQWWMATSVGLYRFPKVARVEHLAWARPKAVYTIKDGLPADDVRRLFEDSRDDLWIGMDVPSREMLVRWERATGTFHRYSESQGVPPFNRPTSFCEDRLGNLWISFREGGLARYRDGRLKFFTTADGVPAGSIGGLYIDRAGRLWISSDKAGLGRLEDAGEDRLRFVTDATARSIMVSIGGGDRLISEDQWGRLYFSSASGVDRIDLATGRVKHYTADDGLASNYVMTVFRDHRGDLWFGTLKGLSRLIPELDQPQSSPPVLIGGLRVAGVSQPLSELGETEVSGLMLEPSQNQLQIDFFGLSFAVGEALRYQYKLEGADADWSALTEQRSITYANLSPGRYRFLVRAVSANNSTSPTPATIAFTILPPFWQRWWFLMLAAVFVGLVVYAVYRYRVARLVEIERVRTRIAADLHDDIGASLSRMAILSEVVKQELGLSHQGSVQRLTEVAETARSLVDAVSDVIWSIDPRRDDLKNVITRVRQFASDVLDAKGIRWDFQTPSNPEKVKLTPEERRHLYLIFKEAIHNIVRHADCTSVRLAIRLADHALLAEIHDDGHGFAVPGSPTPDEQERQGHGLENMQARAAQLGGQLRIDSSPGYGTRLTLSLPLK